MTPEEAAEKLDGNQYRDEGSRELFAEMRKHGLVAVYGASDDLMEFAGAIDDEVGAWEGTTAYISHRGLVKNECDEGDSCPNWKQTGKPIKAIWAPESGGSWAYETEIPHATFKIMEDDDLYCTGIVFRLIDISPI